MGMRTKGIITKSTLLLNSTFEVLTTVSIKRAIRLYMAGKVVFIKTRDDGKKIHPRLDVGIPVVICMKRYVHVPYRQIPITRRNILLRDNYKCFPGETPVLMANCQSKNIEEIKIGDEIIDIYGEKQKVLKTKTKKFIGDMVSLKSYGEQPLISTYNHKIAVIKRENLITEKRNNKNGNSIMWRKISKIDRKYLEFINAEDINIGDILLHPIIKGTNYHKDTIDLKKYLSNMGFRFAENEMIDYHNKVFDRFVSIDKDLAFFFGLYIAEGSIADSYPNKYPNSTAFAFHQDETEYHNKIINICNRFNINYYIWKDKKSKGICIFVCCSWITRMLLSLFGRRCDTKRFHKDVFKFKEELLLEMFRGWACGDAHICHKSKKFVNKTSVCTSSRKIAFDSRNILFSLGIFPTIEIVKREIKKTSYYLNFMSEENRKLWGEEIKFKKSNKRHVVDIEGINYLIMPIIDKKVYQDSLDVYDIEVENSHTFIAGGLAVHNCQYSGELLTEKTATIDHVIPKSHRKFPGNTWTNLVACTKSVNNFKGDKTPEEAGLKLLKKPHAPRWEELILQARPEWGKFMRELKGEKNPVVEIEAVRK
jgi:5-methylcytosine-specific restriction endonuclease McrA